MINSSTKQSKKGEAPGGVQGGDEEGGELQLVISRVGPGRDVVVPVHPVPGLGVQPVLEHGFRFGDVGLHLPDVHFKLVAIPAR